MRRRRLAQCTLGNIGGQFGGNIFQRGADAFDNFFGRHFDGVMHFFGAERKLAWHAFGDILSADADSEFSVS